MVQRKGAGSVSFRWMLVAEDLKNIEEIISTRNTQCLSWAFCELTEGALMFKSRTLQHPQLRLFPAKKEELHFQAKVKEGGGFEENAISRAGK